MFTVYFFTSNITIGESVWSISRVIYSCRIITSTTRDFPSNKGTINIAIQSITHYTQLHIIIIVYVDHVILFQSRAIYAADLMLEWSDDDHMMQPKLLEINYSPDCDRACRYHSNFYNHMMTSLFLDQTSDIPITPICTPWIFYCIIDYIMYVILPLNSR